MPNEDARLTPIDIREDSLLCDQAGNVYPYLLSHHRSNAKLVVMDLVLAEQSLQAERYYNRQRVLDLVRSALKTLKGEK